MTEVPDTDDPLRSGPWTPDQAASLDQWRQGHVLEGVPLIALGPRGGEEAFWESSTRIAEAGALEVLGQAPPCTHKAMVVSQGCDLVKTKFPFATVVPVYDAEPVISTQQASAAKAGMIWHLVHLTAPWAADGLWVADLRLEMPLDKTVLASQQPTEGFADETGYARLAERLGAVRQRPAVPQPSIDHVVKPLRDALSQRRKAGVDPLAGVREVRLLSNDPVTPTAVTVFVIAEEGGQQPDADEWTALVDAVHERAAAYGIALTGPDISTLWEMSAADYITSHGIDAADSS